MNDLMWLTLSLLQSKSQAEPHSPEKKSYFSEFEIGKMGIWGIMKVYQGW